MNARVQRLRNQSLEATPSLSIERALLVTDFYKEHAGRHSTPVLRAMNFDHLCRRKTIYIGADELIVGERGPRPKSVPTFPELTCHSAEDLRILNSRPMTRYTISEEDIRTYEREVIPYWQGRTMRDRIFGSVPDEWKRGLRGGPVHRVHGAARARAHGARRHDLRQGHAGLQARDRRAPGARSTT